MTGLNTYPFETAMCMWAFIFSLMVCLIMLLMKKVLQRNNILFFFWFMVNAVYQVLEITALRRPDVLPYRTMIQLVYVFNTIVIAAALSISVNGGARKAFHLRSDEWAFILVNGAAAAGVLSGAYMAASFGIEGFGSLPMIVWTAEGILSAAVAIAADNLFFAAHLRRLRRCSPHMLYIFIFAVFLGASLFTAIFGLSLAGIIYTCMFLIALAFGMLGQNYRKSLSSSEISAPTVRDVLPETVQPMIRHMEQTVQNIYDPSADGRLLVQNPHFICNTLNNVYYQIDHDQESAKQAVTELSDYMQGKYNALRMDHMIPLEVELKTLNSYLSLQKIRYEDQLHIETNYQATGFMLPALCMQIPAEHMLSNILLHRKDIGILHLQTKKEEQQYVIQMSCEDDLNDEESLKHIFSAFPLLESVRGRLGKFCDGSIKAYREGRNTVIEIDIPAAEEEDSAESSSAAADAV